MKKKRPFTSPGQRSQIPYFKDLTDLKTVREASQNEFILIVTVNVPFRDFKLAQVVTKGAKIRATQHGLYGDANGK